VNFIDELILPFFRSMSLDTYLLDPEVSELMITSGLVFVERAGKMTEVEGIRIDERKLRAGVEIIGQSIGDQIEGVVLTIRKFLRHFTTDELVERGSLTPAALEIMLAAVRGRKNVLVSGGTSTGKTTMTNAFVRHIPAHERISDREARRDEAGPPKQPRLEAYPRLEGPPVRPEVTVSQLLSLTLRHRPDRIIGEEKDSEPAYGLLQAMLNRLASLAMPGFGSLDLSRQETAAAIDIVVEVKRSVDGWRGVNCVLEVTDYDERGRNFETQELYRRSAA
jgi:pilus assembly protein CpaF